MSDAIEPSRPAGAPGGGLTSEELLSKLRGLERLRVAGFIPEARYREQVATIEAARARLASAPQPWPGAPTPAPQPATDPPAAPPAQPYISPAQVTWPPPHVPPPPAVPPAARTSSAVRIGAVGVAAALVAAAAGAVAYARGRGAPTSVVAAQAAKASASPAATPAPTTVTAFIPVAERFVEQHRGLRFTSPVRVTLLDDAAFTRRLFGDAPAGSSPESDQSGNELVALHLLPRGVSLDDAARSTLSLGVSGFYDYRTTALFVRGVALTPYVREVLVHELTHAVQDQHFQIDRPELRDSNDERALAFTALYEGDAMRIQGEYHDSMSDADRAASDGEQRAQVSGAPANIPPVVTQLVGLPYSLGPDFVRAVVATGGNARLDRAFADPPTTTAQLLEPELFLEGRGAVDVPLPASDARSADTGVLGEVMLLLVFEELDGVDGITQDDARRAAALWGGDRYVAWNQAGRSCLRDTVAADTGAHQPELDASLAYLAAHIRGAAIRTAARGPATVTFCG